ncbi:RNA polymerase sigma factor [Caulifigura coniformis]|uniref:RNA polymerase sigma factor n=1 Tax=Caulifigura coniformis TaxID=2527983 RepID=A0A517SGA4_9PLAN|nr:sigma-70 family RNA polymerase sigma factor [Caulifigura coniformis]QDT55107.1 RNA polymerase sigma factor [Caulifigura coniformis]
MRIAADHGRLPIAERPVKETDGVGDAPDRHAPFLRLFTANESSIRSYVRRLVPSRSDVDDLMQNIAVVLWEKFGQFRLGGDFRAWAFGIARFEVLSWLRDQGRDRRTLAGDVVELIADESATPESESALSAQRVALEHCLGKLPAEQRQLLLHAHQPGSSMGDAAAQSGRTKVAFYQWLYRLRHSLLNCVRRQVAQEAAV